MVAGSRLSGSLGRLWRPFYPAISLQLHSYQLAYFYSATLAWFCSALDRQARTVHLAVHWQEEMGLYSKKQKKAT